MLSLCPQLSERTQEELYTTIQYQAGRLWLRKAIVAPVGELTLRLWLETVRAECFARQEWVFSETDGPQNVIVAVRPQVACLLP